MMDLAAKLGEMVAQHPAIEKYKEAQKALSADTAANQMLQQFEQKAQVLMRNEQMGQPVTAGERQELETLQQTIASNIKVKAFSIAQTDMTDLLRKVSQAWQKPVAAAQGQPEQGGPGAPGGSPIGGSSGASPFAM
ncbi:MAG: YlbF family regulator, partial [Planctomycetota bacterium]